MIALLVARVARHLQRRLLAKSIGNQETFVEIADIEFRECGKLVAELVGVVGEALERECQTVVGSRIGVTLAEPIELGVVLVVFAIVEQELEAVLQLVKQEQAAIDGGLQRHGICRTELRVNARNDEH